jgi:hypothetical protein
VPHQVGAFSFSDSIAYPDTTAGRGYSYQDSGGTRADLFVYPVTRTAATLPSDSLRLAREADLFLAGIAERRKRGAIGEYQVPVNDALARSDPGLPGRVVVVIWERNGKKEVSFTHLFVLAGRFLKARLTLSAEEWETSTAPNFGPDIAALLASGS